MQVIILAHLEKSVSILNILVVHFFYGQNVQREKSRVRLFLEGRKLNLLWWDP